MHLLLRQRRSALLTRGGSSSERTAPPPPRAFSTAAATSSSARARREQEEALRRLAKELPEIAKVRSSAGSALPRRRAPQRRLSKPLPRLQLTPQKRKPNQQKQQEAADAARRVGFQKGARRAFQAAEAIASLAREAALAAATGKPIDPPERLLRRLFEALGATYIKLAQLIASSPSLFPAELVEEMQACLDATPETPWPQIERTIREEVASLGGGRSLESTFESIDRRPLASASVAQVHRAVLKGSGKEVVIKVLKPGVEDVLSMDLDAAYLGARLAEALIPQLARRLSLRALASDARQTLKDEVDLRKEALHMAAFREFLERRGLTGAATCPDTYPALSSRRVLVMSRLDGVPLTDLGAVAAHLDPRCGVTPEAALLRALNVWALSVADERVGTFHGDLHSANLFVLRDGRAAFLDFGIVGRLGPGTRAGLSALGAALATGDYERAARALGAIGAVGGGLMGEEAAGGGAWAEAERAERRQQQQRALQRSSPRFEGGEDALYPADDAVDYAAFGRDLAAFASSLDALGASSSVVVVEANAASAPSAAAAAAATAAVALDVDPAALNRVALDLVRISERHGVRLPRDFALLFKQAIFFDRYTKALAPGLDVRAAAAQAFSSADDGGGAGF
jgi:aarF domain-containing kinase